MARIPEAEIERLKSEVSLLRLVEAAGIELKKQGKDWAGRCPFHDDKTPSLIVSPDKNLWHCLGACNIGGTVIDWTMKVHGVSFRHAVELLREQPSSLAAEAAPVKIGTVRKLAAEAPFAPDALKLLQSEGVVSIASTGKNAVTGNLETQEYRVEGPVMLFSTTTAIDLDEELLNRCLVLAVDESREQTQAIHAEQRKRRTLEGLRASQDKQRLMRLHQNAQRLLRPLKVVNPYAERLTFLSDKTRTRRDHEKYLALIDALALLHQNQRKVQREVHEGQAIDYVEVSLSDIEQANALAHDVLGRTLDELPPQTRRLLQVIAAEVAQACVREKLKQADYRFSRKQVRQWSGWTDFQVKKHMQRLEEMEYVLIHRGRRGQSFEYELLYQGEGEQGDAFLMGLIDVSALYDEKKKPPPANKEPSGRPQAAAKVPRGSNDENHLNTKPGALSRAMPEADDENAIPRSASGLSHRSRIASSLVAASYAGDDAQG